MAYQTTWEPTGFIMRFTGDITGEEIDEANECFFRDPRSDSARFQLVDLSQITSVDISVQDMARTAAYDLGASRSNPRIKLAFVCTYAPMTKAVEEYIRVSRSLKSSWRFAIFEDEASAREWAEI
ncbi:hypothetical protein [Cerasicoccus maritimus]|uniref:hypothetical protein n=1 Tax=Cerasicoccus maritimus TaxID=490089 RepID=UPI0028529890|nr:hypothetical protein [Cerasicoccus maritimus]